MRVAYLTLNDATRTLNNYPSRSDHVTQKSKSSQSDAVKNEVKIATHRLCERRTVLRRLDLAVPAEFDDETGTDRLARPTRSDFTKDFAVNSAGNTVLFERR